MVVPHSSSPRLPIAMPHYSRALHECNIIETLECEKSFTKLKEYMSRAPLLSTHEPSETLMIYLSVSFTAVSLVLIRQPTSAEHPVYYVSKALQDIVARYSDIKRLALALVVLEASNFFFISLFSKSYPPFVGGCFSPE
ncbi:hypothetical protein L3X38_018814 [Prunus dulcis]|uniref:Reverse transcriptase/retrotransposon-derived protein RNase H-like domain-containing protein n=1 Tax=Prunus dulcis TaxID=3755 RepID=A0AAD4WCF4_PRUDU|nr:hypothetical protein L3X38_018814 [Prunus dulcis]